VETARRVEAFIGCGFRADADADADAGGADAGAGAGGDSDSTGDGANAGGGGAGAVLATCHYDVLWPLRPDRYFDTHSRNRVMVWGKRLSSPPKRSHRSEHFGP
jgi:hypothetical protein